MKLLPKKLGMRILRPRPWKKATESSSQLLFVLTSWQKLSFDSFRFLARYFAWRKSKATSMHFEKSRQSFWRCFFFRNATPKSGFRRPDNKLHTQQWIWHHIMEKLASLATTFAIATLLLYLDHYKRGALTLLGFVGFPKFNFSLLLESTTHFLQSLLKLWWRCLWFTGCQRKFGSKLRKITSTGCPNKF